MENTKQIELSTVGEVTKKPFMGTFRVKGILNRRDLFIADAHRRRIIGVNPTDALPALQGEAYMLGQLQSRIIESPDWWAQSASGELLEDANVIAELFEMAVKASDEIQEEINGKANKTLEKITKETEKKQ